VWDQTGGHPVNRVCVRQRNEGRGLGPWSAQGRATDPSDNSRKRAVQWGARIQQLRPMRPGPPKNPSLVGTPVRPIGLGRIVAPPAWLDGADCRHPWTPSGPRAPPAAVRSRIFAVPLARRRRFIQNASKRGGKAKVYGCRLLRVEPLRRDRGKWVVVSTGEGEKKQASAVDISSKRWEGLTHGRRGNGRATRAKNLLRYTGKRAHGTGYRRENWPGHCRCPRSSRKKNRGQRFQLPRRVVRSAAPTVGLQFSVAYDFPAVTPKTKVIPT